MRRPALVLVLLALVAAGCGGGSDDGGGGGAAPTSTPAGNGGSSTSSGGSASSTVKVAADPSGQLRYTTKSLQATAGKDTIDFTNDAAIPHDVVIEQNGKTLGKTKTITDSSTSTTVNLEPGTYTYYCSIPGHRDAGMEGTLTVK